MTTGKTIALTRRTFINKVLSLPFNMLSRLVIAFLLCGGQKNKDNETRNKKLAETNLKCEDLSLRVLCVCSLEVLEGGEARAAYFLQLKFNVYNEHLFHECLLKVIKHRRWHVTLSIL